MEGAPKVDEAEQEGSSSLWVTLGVIGALLAVFVPLLWWFYPLISSRLQRKKAKGRKDEKDMAANFGTSAQRHNKISNKMSNQFSKESKASAIFDIAWQVSANQGEKGSM